MGFFFELVLTGFFSFLIASLLAKLFSSSSSFSSGSHEGADFIVCGGRWSEEVKRSRSRSRRREVQEKKVIEVDKVVEKEAEKRYLHGEERLHRVKSLEVEETSDGFFSEEKNDVLSDFRLTGVVQFEKEELGDRDQIVVEKDEIFGVESSRGFEKEKESCSREVAYGESQLMYEHRLVEDSYKLIFGEDQTIRRQEETSEAVKLNDQIEEKDDKDTLSELKGFASKKTTDTFSAQNSLIMQDEISGSTIVSKEFEKEISLQDNLSEIEGPARKIAKQEESSTLALVLNELENERDHEKEQQSLSNLEGPASKTAPLTEETKEEKEVEFNEEEEWEGIERSETEKRFSVACYYATNDVVSKLTGEDQLKLYGLHKIATEGPCYESSPMAIRSSTRAKWHAWQKLGSMNPDTAMEQYMTLLSQNVPEWTTQPPIEDIDTNGEGKSSEELINCQLTTERNCCAVKKVS